MFSIKKVVKKTYDHEHKVPILRCSICTGEQVFGFKDLETGRFEDILLVRNESDLQRVMKEYEITEITKEY